MYMYKHINRVQPKFRLICIYEYLRLALKIVGRRRTVRRRSAVGTLRAFPESVSRPLAPDPPVITREK